MTYNMNNIPTTPQSYSNIDILWRGTILDIVSVTLFIDVRQPNLLHYDMRDNLALLPSDAWISSYKLISTSGAFALSTGENITPEYAAEQVAAVLANLTSLYSGLSMQAYTKELSSGVPS